MSAKKQLVTFIFLFVGLSLVAKETFPEEDGINQDSIVATYSKKYGRRPFTHHSLRFLFTYSNIDFSNINGYLETSGVPKVQNRLRYLPMVYYTTNIYGKKIYFDTSVSWRNSRTKRNDNYALKQTIFSYDLGFKYIVPSKKRNRLSVGAFFGRTDYKVGINSILPNIQSDMIRKRENIAGIRFFYSPGLVRLTAGYRFGLDGKRVSINGHSNSNNPKFSTEGLFFGIGIVSI